MADLDLNRAGKTGIPFHPLADLFPLIEGEDFEALVRDIRENGLRQPILIWRGSIIDGRNRYRALKAAGVGMSFDIERLVKRGIATDVSGWPVESLAGKVISLNLHRRHLDTTQRAMIAAELVTKGIGRPAGEGENSANLRSFEVAPMGREEAAALLNVSPRSVDSARALKRDAPAEVIDAAKRGDVSLHAATERVAAVRAELGRAGEPVSPEVLNAAYSAFEARFEAEARAKKEARQADKKARRATRESALGGTIAAGNASLAAMGASGKRYGVILADPEWRFETYSRETGMDRAADNHYPTSPTDVIAARPVADIAAKDCVLFLWATAPMMPDALAVMTAWGFKYRSHTIWRKAVISGADMNASKGDRGGYSTGVVLGTGYWFRNCHELLLVGTRGDVPCPAMGLQFPSVIDAAPLRHSQKPERFHELIESYFPSLPKIELNARAARPGWDLWGAEAPVVVADEAGAAEPDDLDVILSPAECRRRREALGLLPAAVAREARIGATTIRHFEAGRGRQREGWRVLLRDALARLEATGAAAPGGGE